MRMRIVRRALAAALVLGASAARGESMSRDSVCASPPVPHDSVHVVVTAVAKVDSTLDSRAPALPADFLMYVVEAVRTHFTPPAEMTLGVLGSSMPGPPTTWMHEDLLHGPKPFQGPVSVPSALRVDAYFTLNAHGTPRDIRVGHSSLNLPLETGIASAIAAIVPDDYGMIPPNADGTRIHLHVDAAPFDFKTEQPFFATWLPVFRMERPAAAPGNAALPVYPSNARFAGIGDTVLTRFVIDRSGRAIPGSIDISRLHYRDFMDAVVPVILRTKFRPAVVDGCNVASAVGQAFVFTIDR